VPKNIDKKTDKIELRISPTDKETIQLNATEIGTSISRFMIAAALGYKLPASRTERRIYKDLVDIKRELNQIGNNLNQLTKICHTNRQLGEPVSVNTQMLESTKETVDRGIKKLDRYLINQTNNNLLFD
jgi:uncharacterized protein (DUF1778 family)